MAGPAVAACWSSELLSDDGGKGKEGKRLFDDVNGAKFGKMIHSVKLTKSFVS